MEPHKGYRVIETDGGLWTAFRLRDGISLGHYDSEDGLEAAIVNDEAAYASLVQAALVVDKRPVGPLISAQTDGEPEQEPDGTRVDETA